MQFNRNGCDKVFDPRIYPKASQMENLPSDTQYISKIWAQKAVEKFESFSVFMTPVPTVDQLSIFFNKRLRQKFDLYRSESEIEFKILIDKLRNSQNLEKIIQEIFNIFDQKTFGDSKSTPLECYRTLKLLMEVIHFSSNPKFLVSVCHSFFDKLHHMALSSTTLTDRSYFEDGYRLQIFNIMALNFR